MLEFRDRAMRAEVSVWGFRTYDVGDVQGEGVDEHEECHRERVRPVVVVPAPPRTVHATIISTATLRNIFTHSKTCGESQSFHDCPGKTSSGVCDWCRRYWSPAKSHGATPAQKGPSTQV